MLVVNSNSQNVFQTSWENIFDTRYPDFNQLLFIPFLGRFSIGAMNQLPTLTISNKTVNFIATNISQAQSLTVNSGAQNVMNYPTNNGSLALDFTSVLLWQFKWGEVIWKHCYAIVRAMVNNGPSGWQNSWSPKIDLSLLHTDWTETSIWTMTSSLSWGVENFHLYLETAWTTAQAGDRLLMRFYNYNLYQNINGRLHWVRFWDNSNSVSWPMTPIQVSID